VRRHVTRIIEHQLKLEHSPAVAPRFDWMSSIAESRGALDDELASILRRDVAENLDRLFDRGRERADLGLRKYGEYAGCRRALGVMPSHGGRAPPSRPDADEHRAHGRRPQYPGGRMAGAAREGSLPG
jgi:hypothetical protein